MKHTLLALGLAVCCSAALFAEPPHVSYIFPAGGQRGTEVSFHVGGHYLHEQAEFTMQGDGIEAPDTVKRTRTTWFEGPVIPQPASQRGEDYPVDYEGKVTIDSQAAPGLRFWNVRTHQGLTADMPFVIGNLPEVVEREIDGSPVPQKIPLPVTVNGRMFPREDVDIWQFPVERGTTITCLVTAAQIGSPLDARLEVRSPSRQRIAEATGRRGHDPVLRFTAKESGLYSVHIHDTAYGGLQHYVYRLTITDGPVVDSVFPRGGRPGETIDVTLTGANLKQQTASLQLPEHTEGIYRWYPELATANARGIPLEVSDSTPAVENPKNDTLEHAHSVTVGTVIDGRIESPGDCDWFSVDARKEQPLTFQVTAESVGSPLDSVLSVWDASGKKLAEADDVQSSPDAVLQFSPPADGTCYVKICDRVSNRGGDEFAYRLHIKENDSSNAAPFSIALTDRVLNLDRGGELKLKIAISRTGFKDPIELSFEGLPERITATGTTVGKNKTKANVTLTAADDAPLGLNEVRLIGTAKLEEQTLTVTAKVSSQPPRDDDETLRLSVNLPTPFKFVGIFESKFAPRGSVYVRHYQLERNGFEGPITVSLADRQVRHLQGVTGPTIVVPPGATEFDYPVTLPPWLVVGRTSRTCLMAVGDQKLEDGTVAKLTYASFAQNDQIIVLTAPEILSVKSDRSSLLAEPGKTASVTVRLERGEGLTGSAQIELDCPEHLRGVSAEAVTIPAGETSASLLLTFAEAELGPFNMPVKLRATTPDQAGNPVTAECELELVAPSGSSFKAQPRVSQKR
jgi:hypothetical protein